MGWQGKEYTEIRLLSFVRWSGNLPYSSGSSTWDPVVTNRDGMKGGVRGRSKGEEIYVYIQLIHFVCAQSHLILHDTMDWSPPGSSAHGILPARILEWVAMPSSRGSL